ncbi:MAG: cation-translocating P-type ATPase [Waddliaceae bacterium]
MSLECTLCQAKFSHPSVIEGEASFCCSGCRAVHGILSAKKQLEGYRDHPLFQQAIAFGLISNPELLNQIKEMQTTLDEGEKKRLVLQVDGLWCPSCAEVIRLVLTQVKGVISCVVDYATDLCIIEYYPKFVLKDKIFRLIHSLGYSSTPIESSEKRSISRSLFWRLLISAFFSINLMMLSYTLYASEIVGDTHTHHTLLIWVMGLLSIPVVIVGGVPLARRAWNGIKVGILGMEALVTVGVTSALAVSWTQLLTGGRDVYFDSMSMVITLVLVGRVLETKAKFSAKDSLLQLSHSLPKRARKKNPDGTAQFVPIKEVRVGDTLLVNSGEKIVLDGVVILGKGLCNESLVTGEAIPISKKPLDRVISGSFLNQGSLEYRVSHEADRSLLYQLVDTVSKDLKDPTRRTNPLDTILYWFVPTACLIAFATAIFGSFLSAVSVLLISCPCAIGIAAPLAESRLLFALLEMGAVVRNRAILSTLGQATVMVFDKTGTVTEGNFEVISGIDEISQDERSVLRSLANRSSHPISRCIASYIQESLLPTTNFTEHPGLGIEGLVGTKRVKLGSSRFVGAKNDGLYFSIGKKQYPLELGDRVRKGVSEVLSQLGSRSVLLSGDREESVKKVADICGFKEWRSEVQPLQKREYIQDLQKQGEIVAMIGDGFNDAPALAASDIGITLASSTDFSIHVSDLSLTHNRLEVLPKIQNLGRQGRKIVRQNLFWAFFYNTIGIGVAAFGYLTPLFAAIAMALSSLMTVINARRL